MQLTHQSKTTNQRMGSTKGQIKSTSEVEEEEACMYAMQLATASVLPMVLKSAIELDVLEIIAKAGPGAHITPSEIATHLHAKNPDAPVMLDRVLRLLASYKVLTCILNNLDDGRVERLYGLAPVCKFFVKNEDGVSLASSLLVSLDKVLMEGWYHMKDAVLDGGIPFNKAHGMAAFEYFGTNPRFNKVFNTGMSAHSTIVMNKILEKYRGFEGLKSVVDVGGGIGSVLNMIISKYPMIKGVNFDLPHVIKDAPSYPNIEHVGGDMFVSVPRGDTIFMKWILHNWSDEKNLKLLKNCYEALPQDGKVIVVESILPVFPETNLAAKRAFQIDNAMMVHFLGGKERMEKEFEALAKGAGFAGFRVICGACTVWVMEICKKV